MEGARLSPFNAASFLSTAGHASVWGRDRGAAADVYAAFVATGAHGGVTDLRKASIAAGIAGLEGRTDDAVASFRSVIESLQAMSARLEGWLTTLDLVATVPAANVDPAIVDAARSGLAGVGAKPFLAILDRFLEGGTVGGEPRSGSRAATVSPAAAPAEGS